MEKYYLYRLYRHSPWAFMLALLFVGIYSVSMYKKMDMVFFPYNNMYAIDFNRSSNATTYGVKINGGLVRITHYPYWKKDFLETSLNGYCRYVQHGNKVFLDDYIQYRFPDQKIRSLLLKNLVPGKIAAHQWPAWFAAFAGHDVPLRATVELMQYNFSFENGEVVQKDSISIYKSILP